VHGLGAPFLLPQDVCQIPSIFFS